MHLQAGLDAIATRSFRRDRVLRREAEHQIQGGAAGARSKGRPPPLLPLSPPPGTTRQGFYRHVPADGRLWEEGEGGGKEGGPFDLILGSRCVLDLNLSWMVYYRQLVPHL